LVFNFFAFFAFSLFIEVELLFALAVLDFFIIRAPLKRVAKKKLLHLHA